MFFSNNTDNGHYRPMAEIATAAASTRPESCQVFVCNKWTNVYNIFIRDTYIYTYTLQIKNNNTNNNNNNTIIYNVYNGQ